MAGASVQHGQLSLSVSGRWWADVIIDTATVPTGQVTIAADGGLSLVGTVARAGVRLDSVHARIVGGKNTLAAQVRGAWRFAQVRDPLNAVLAATGEQLAPVDPALLALSLPLFTLAGNAGSALDAIADAAARALGSEVNWRFLSDGTLWLGAESWPTATLPADAEVADTAPAEHRVIISAATPALLPGVNLDGVGKVAAVDHWVEPASVRTWAWLA